MKLSESYQVDLQTSMLKKAMQSMPSLHDNWMTNTVGTWQ
jgi:hypothetical protein